VWRKKGQYLALAGYLQVPEPAIVRSVRHDPVTTGKEQMLNNHVKLLGSVSVRLAVPPKSQVAPSAPLFCW
jgi:hypothetical protein